MHLLLGLALLEVMDKEPGITSFWMSATLWGIAGYFLPRRRWWWALPVLLLLAASFAATWSEWTDPFVGPAIAREAGRFYPYHLVASTILAACLTIAGMVRPRRRSILRSTTVAAILAVTFSRVALAQQNDAAAQMVRAHDCLAAIPDSALTRVTAFASVTMIDSVPRAMRADVANLVQVVAERAATLLGGTPGTLPPGEPSITWRELYGKLLVTLHRDGHLTLRVEGDSAEKKPRGIAAIKLLARALGAVQADGYTFMTWPDGFSADSTAFDISFEWPRIDSAGRIHPISVPLAVPMFSVAAPREKPAGSLVPPRLAYPSSAELSSTTGTVFLEFVVDTLGRADMTTVHDRWVGDHPRPMGNMANFYLDFVASARTGVKNAQYTPARIGGCPVRQLVQQAFTFRIP